MVYSSASVAEMLVLQDLHELCGFWNFQLEIFLSSGEVMVGRYWCHSGFFWKRGPGLNNWQIPVLQVSFRPSPSRVPQRAVESRRLERKDVILKAKQGSRFWNVIMWSLIAQKMLQGLQITTCLLWLWLWFCTAVYEPKPSLEKKSPFCILNMVVCLSLFPSLSKKIAT